MGVPQFVSETVSVHHTCIIELVSSVLEALDPEFRSIVEVLNIAERNDTVYRVNPDPVARPPHPSF